MRARRLGRRDAAELGAAYAELMAPLMEITRDHLDRGLDVFAAGKQIGAFDAVLAAATLANGATALVSADSDFSEVRSLDHVVPDREGVGQLLSSG